MTTRQTPDAVREDMFADWSTKTLADQCHMQAREQLDPEFTQFMTAVGNRLAALDSRAGDAGEGERIAIREFLIACADAADFQASRYGGGLAMVRCRVEAKAYRNAARMIFEQDHASYRPATPAPAVDAVPAGEWQKIVRDMLDGVKGARDRARAALSQGEGRK